mmetsp:Transcript_1352/g.1763  ORF Transcript_1352/g.1763 Transcript_1352/m.1763 type:complete len:130 (-) Transcript_1352:889-1278(-)
MFCINCRRTLAQEEVEQCPADHIIILEKSKDAFFAQMEKPQSEASSSVPSEINPIASLMPSRVMGATGKMKDDFRIIVKKDPLSEGAILVGQGQEFIKSWTIVNSGRKDLKSSSKVEIVCKDKKSPFNG